MDTVHSQDLPSFSAADLAARLGRDGAPLILDVRKPPAAIPIPDHIERRVTDNAAVMADMY